MNNDPQPAPESVSDLATTTPEPLPVEEIARLSAAIIERVATVVVGMSEAVEVALASILAGGHVLFEDVPGWARHWPRAASHRRWGWDSADCSALPTCCRPTSPARSFTPPLPPSSCFVPDQFHGLFLADEINRTSPKPSRRCSRRWRKGK